MACTASWSKNRKINREKKKKREEVGGGKKKNIYNNNNIIINIKNNNIIYIVQLFLLRDQIIIPVVYINKWKKYFP